MLQNLKDKLIEGKAELLKAVEFVKTQPTAYLDLVGRRLVDAAITIIVGHLLLGQAVKNERKQRVARRFIETGPAGAADALRTDPGPRHQPAG